MKVMLPVTMTDAMLVSHTEPETDHAAWAAGTTYAASTEGSPVKVIHLHRRYESLQGGNIGHTPSGTDAWWLDLGPTNRWAMFDERVNTITTAAAYTMTVRVAPLQIVNSLALIEVNCTAARVRMYDGATLVYDVTKDLDQSTIDDWFIYLTAEFYFVTETLFEDLPPYGDGEILIDLTSPSAGGVVPSIGNLAFGRVYEIGGTQYGVTVGITDYSRKSTDSFGVTSLVQRDYSRRMNAQVMVENFALRRIYQLLATLRATPCVWIGADDLDTFTPTMVWGYYRDWSVDIAYPNQSLCSLEIEGMI